MLDIAPELRIVDITHDIPPFDVRAGRARARPRGAVPARRGRARGRRSRRRHRAALHRGRGRERRASSAPTTACSRRRSRCSAVRRASSRSTTAEYQLPAPGPTFAGPRRDGARGRAPRGRRADRRCSGPRSTRVQLAPGARAASRRRRRRDASPGEVLWVDRFGNCQLNVAPEQLARARRRPRRRARGDAVDAAGVRAAGAPAGCARSPTPSRRSSCVLVDSYGMCTLALDRRSAAAELGLRTGSAVTVAVEGAACGRRARRARELRTGAAAMRPGTSVDPGRARWR